MWIVRETVAVNTNKVDAFYIDDDNRLVAAYRGDADITILFRARTLDSAKAELKKIMDSIHLRKSVHEMPEDEIFCD